MSVNKLYIGNLAWTTTEAELNQEFSRYGTVTEAKIITDRDTGRSKGFAFVTYENEEGADKAITALDGQEFGGRQLRVSVAENRPRRPRTNNRNFGGGGNYDRGGRFNRRDEY